MENEAFLGRRKNWHKKINNFDNHDSLTIVKKKKNTCRCKAVCRQFN